MTQHHGCTEDHGSGVGLVGAHDVGRNVTASRLEESVVTADVAARDDTGATDEGSADVRHDGTVKVGHDHDIELLRLGNELHGGVVDNHVVRSDTGCLVLFRDSAEGVEEETVTELHDVGLVHASDLLAVVLECEVEGKAADTLSLSTGRNLQALDDTREALVLKTRVLALSVLTDDSKVNVRVTSRDARKRLAEHDGRVDIKLLPHGNVP
jgi:hypothetical protein